LKIKINLKKIKTPKKKLKKKINKINLLRITQNLKNKYYQIKSQIKSRFLKKIIENLRNVTNKNIRKNPVN
jgi:hypothetical protein